MTLPRVLVALVTAVALFGVPSIGAAQSHRERSPRERRGPTQPVRSVPEFDPAAGGAIAAVLAGGGLLLARRRRR